jgi:hypothetical protein
MRRDPFDRAAVDGRLADQPAFFRDEAGDLWLSLPASLGFIMIVLAGCALAVEGLGMALDWWFS